MTRLNIEIVKESFKKQAEQFESPTMNFSKEEYLQYMVEKIMPSKNEKVLEVAAGTCVCGRKLSYYTDSAVCVDITEEMLKKGRQYAEEKGINNILFIKGVAEDLPFLENSFDIVISRLAFHHFVDIYKPFDEMFRVLKPGGKLVISDMEAVDEPLRDREDKIETWRDPSHVRNLSRMEMCDLFHSHGMEIELCENTEIPVSLESWMDLTQTPEIMRQKIEDCMEKDIMLGERTGFSPYRTEQGISFLQRWLLTIGIKNKERYYP